MLHKIIFFCSFVLFSLKMTHTVSIAQKSFDLQGHRGARGLMPENTIPGFLKAIDLKVNTLELDVVITKDKQCILSHEPFLSHEICLDSTGNKISENDEKKWNIYQMTVSEVQKCDCGSSPHPRFPAQNKMQVYKPTLKELIETTEKYIKDKQLPTIFYNIETKSQPEGDDIFHPKPEEFAQILYNELKSLNILEKVFIQSFDVRTLQAFKKIDPKVRLVLLVENKNSFKQNLKDLGFQPEIYSPNYKLVTPELVKAVQTKGMKIIPWTINEITDMKAIIEMGVDGLITDYPDRYFDK